MLNQYDNKMVNLKKVLTKNHYKVYVALCEGLSQSEIARQIGQSRQQVNFITKRLIAKGIVKNAKKSIDKQPSVE